MSEASMSDRTIAGTFSDISAAYGKNTSPECKAIDAFLVFTVLMGVSQAAYCFLTNSFPYNAFIGVFAASLGSFVFAANARFHFSQTQELSKLQVVHAVTEFVVCSVILNVLVANFIG